MKTKLTKEITEEICKRLKVGCYAKMAAAALGICERAYYNWLERGSKAEKLSELGRKVPEEDKIYLQFMQSVRQAEGESQVVLTTMIFSQAQDDWRAALEILSRKWPEQWAKKEFMDFKGTISDGPDKRQEALNEFEEMFAGVPKSQLSIILSETSRKLHEAKSNNHNGKAKKTEPGSNTRSDT